ncbi:MAG TPA: hypothetical protein VFW75_16240, partial [Acetobacteraceae bacterium]|nr:hypothetical protein [Acetobacteraceae bacterium]
RRQSPAAQGGTAAGQDRGTVGSHQECAPARPVILQSPNCRLYYRLLSKYLVVGAYAVSIHTQPRAINDLDILIKPDGANARKVFAALAQFGVSLQGMIGADFAEPGRFFPMGREPVSVDILTDIPGVEFDAAWKRRVVDAVDPASGLKVGGRPHCRQAGDRAAAGHRGRGRHP